MVVEIPALIKVIESLPTLKVQKWESKPLDKETLVNSA